MLHRANSFRFMEEAPAAYLHMKRGIAQQWCQWDSNVPIVSIQSALAVTTVLILSTMGVLIFHPWSDLFVPNHFKCKGLLLHLITLIDTHRHTHTHTHILYKRSACLRGLYMTTQHSQETDIHASGGVRTHNPSKWETADPRLRLCDHWDWLVLFKIFKFNAYKLSHLTPSPIRLDSMLEFWQFTPQDVYWYRFL